MYVAVSLPNLFACDQLLLMYHLVVWSLSLIGFLGSFESYLSFLPNWTLILQVHLLSSTSSLTSWISFGYADAGESWFAKLDHWSNRGTSKYRQESCAYSGQPWLISVLHQFDFNISTECPLLCGRAVSKSEASDSLMSSWLQVYSAIRQEVSERLNEHSSTETRAQPGQPWVRGWDDNRKVGGPQVGNQ